MIRHSIIILTIVISITNLCGQKKFNINEYNAEKNFERGIFYYHETKFLSAIEFFIKALQYNPEYYRAKIWLGKSYYKAGHLPNAIEEWQDAVNNGGADNIVINRLNNIYYRFSYSKKLLPVDQYIHLKTINGNRWDSSRFLQPISLAINNDQELFITGLASRSVLHFDRNYKKKNKISSGSKSFKMPFNIKLDNFGNMYISDIKRDIVQKFDKNGNHKLTFGGTGVKEGKFAGPEGIAIDRYDNIYVVDTGNCRVQKFSSDGKFLMKFGQRGSLPGQFLRPTGITIDKQGDLYVSDHLQNKIQKFDEDGNFIDYQFEDKRFKDIRNIHSYQNDFLIADGVNGGYIYNHNNGTWKHFKNFNYARDKLLSVSDMIINKDYLYISDFYKNTVEVFVPEHYKYSNLDLQIDMVDTSQYPRIVLYCSVYKKNGQGIAGLAKENFTIKELGVRMFPYDILESLENKNKVMTVFLVEKSITMRKYQEDLKEAASYFLKDIFNTKDKVQVFNFHKNEWIGLNYAYSKLKILDALSEDNYHYLSDVSRPLFKSITELMNKLNRKALVFFTTGDFDMEENFKNYKWDICKNYAKVNHVPIYIINFTRKNERNLKELASQTGGKYYYYFRNTRKLKRIRDEVVRKPINQYVIVYNALDNKKLIDTWREIQLEVNHNKLSGTDKIGYFVPKH